jgi:hypothetical protein
MAFLLPERKNRKSCITNVIHANSRRSIVPFRAALSENEREILSGQEL